MSEMGFNIQPGEHPIVPVMLGDAAVAARMAARLLEKGVYVVGFSFPVVPKGKARIRVQISAAHTRAGFGVRRSSNSPPLRKSFPLLENNVRPRHHIQNARSRVSNRRARMKTSLIAGFAMFAALGIVCPWMSYSRAATGGAPARHAKARKRKLAPVRPPLP